MSKISINLLVYNGLKFLPQCLDSVLNQSYKDYNFLIIDNNSNDGSREYLKKWEDNLGDSASNIWIIFNDENAGFCGGHNQGIESGNSEYILCLNQDVILDRDFVKNAIEILDKDDTIGSLQPKILRLKEVNGKMEKTDIIDTTGLVMFKNRRIVNRDQGKEDSRHRISAFAKAIADRYANTGIFGADGAAPVYRRKALTNIKLFGEYFDEDFFMYKEDVDLAWRMRLYNWEAVYAPDVAAWHARGAGDSAKTSYYDVVKERRKISEFSKYYSFKNQRLMQIKNESLFLLLLHLPWWLPKEIVSWVYVLIFEHYTIKSIRKLIKQLPGAVAKRRIIMRNKKAGIKEMKKWFK